MEPEENIVFCDTILTRVAGYRYHATAAPTPGSPVRFVREPQNPFDPNAIAVCDSVGLMLGYLFREIAEEYASLIDAGCVRLSGRLAAPGEPHYDTSRAESNPSLIVWVYADVARLDVVCAGAAAIPASPGRDHGTGASGSD